MTPRRRGDSAAVAEERRYFFEKSNQTTFRALFSKSAACLQRLGLGRLRRAGNEVEERCDATRPIMINMLDCVEISPRQICPDPNQTAGFDTLGTYKG
jgi:hypothetical protein